MTATSNAELNAAAVGALAPLLGSGKMLDTLASELRPPRPGDGESESALRIKIRELVNDKAIIDSLVGVATTSGTLTVSYNNGVRVLSVTPVA